MEQSGVEYNSVEEWSNVYQSGPKVECSGVTYIIVETNGVQ